MPSTYQTRIKTKATLRREGIQLLEAGRPRGEVAERLGVSVTTVRTWDIERQGPLCHGPAEARPRALALLRQGATIQAVAKQVGVDPLWVRVWRRALGLPRRPPVSPARTLGEAMLRKGQRPADIARALGVGVDTVQLWRRRLGLPPAPRPPRTTPHIHPRRAEGEALLRQGHRPVDVARAIGASITAVRDWRRRLGVSPPPPPPLPATP